MEKEQIKRQLLKAALVVLFLVALFVAAKAIANSNLLKPKYAPLSQTEATDGRVLGESTSVQDLQEADNVAFYLPTVFYEDVTFRGNITASNVLNSLTAGTGIQIVGDQSPTVTNTGVVSLAGKTGVLALEAGSGITIDGLKISATGTSSSSTSTTAIVSLTAGTGITVSGSTITNADAGSSQNIFKTIKVTGEEDIVAGSNTDTLNFAVGTGLSIASDPTTKKLTFSASGSDLNISGWGDANDVVSLLTSTDKVGIGTTNPTAKLHIVGDTKLEGSVSLGGTASDTVTFNSQILSGSSIIPSVDLGSDLGSSSNRFNNIWVAHINTNSSQSYAGQTTFSYAPTDVTFAKASIIVNPTTSATNGFLTAWGVGGYQKAGVDEDGDVVVGYSGNTSISATDNPLEVYNHGNTRIAYFDTNGNLNIDGSIVSGSGMSTTGDLNISVGHSILPSTDGENAISIANAANVDFVSFDTVNSRVGIGTTSPGATFAVGLASPFKVDANGNLTMINNVAYSWPTAQAEGTTVLTNDGSGNLTWANTASGMANPMTTGGDMIYGLLGGNQLLASLGATKVSDSGVYMGNWGLTMDANDSTSVWTSDRQNPWVVFDLGSAKKIGSVVLKNEWTGKYVSTFRMEYSANAVDWVEMPTAVVTGASFTSNFASPITARYWKLQVLSGSTGGMKIFAIELVLSGTGYPTRLAIGSEGQHMVVQNGVPAWTTNIGIGTTAPTTALDVVGGLKVSQYATTSASLAVGTVNAAAGPGNISMSGNFNAGGTLTFSRVSNCASGLVTSAGGVVSCLSSDQNLKENIVPITSALEKIRLLRGVSFDWKDKTKYGDQTEVGLIAQEVEAIVPELVFTAGDGTKGVKYGQMVGLLIESIKSQQLEIDSNATKLESLMQRVDLLNSNDAGNSSVSVTELKDLVIGGSLIVEADITVKGQAFFEKTVQFSEVPLYETKDVAGQAIIPWGETQVVVKFTKAYREKPIVNITTVTEEATESAFIVEKNQAYVAKVTKEGFIIVLPKAVAAEATYNWVAVQVKDPLVTKGEATLSKLIEELAKTDVLEATEESYVATVSAQ